MDVDYAAELTRLQQLLALVDEYSKEGKTDERAHQLREEIADTYGRVSDVYGQIAGQQKIQVPPNSPRATIYPNLFEAGFLSGRTFHTDQGRAELRKVIGIAKQRAERAAAKTQAEPPRRAAGGTRVFIVHGHNEAMVEGTARFVERLGLQPTVLREEPNKGRTIIEKFEDHADEAGFAIVLLTADDVGAVAPRGESPPALAPRARQNAILELGFFAGRLGRHKVCALYEEGVELPSDLQGVLYVSIDAGGAWKMFLARELKAADLRST